MAEQKTVRGWDAAERLAADLEKDGHRILGMSEERSGIRVTWQDRDTAARSSSQDS